MLIQTGRGSISFVAGCSWVNSVKQSAPFQFETRDKQQPTPTPQAPQHRWPWAS
jgi:uncharacterized lipoprotein